MEFYTLYTVSEEDKIKIRTALNVSDAELKSKIEILKNWTKNSPELPLESQDEDYLHVILLRSKFKEDIAKKNIENYFKCTGKYPDIFEKLGKFKPSEEVGIAVPSPTPAPNFERIAILKLNPKLLKTKRLNINQMIIIAVTVGAIMYTKDYTPSTRFLIDFEGVTMFDFLRLNIRDLYKLLYISEKILRGRIAGIELLNAPRIMSALLGIAKMLLKPKLFSRVTPHSSLSSVYENIPKECLPSDYGGDSECVKKLIEIWDEIIAENQNFFQKFANYSKSG